MMRAGLLLRSLAFWCVMTVSVVIWAPLSLFTAPFPFHTRYRFISLWTRMNLWSLEHICKLNYRVTGRENLPCGNAIVMAKHQSAWETLFLQIIFPGQAWIIKRELLWIPFFGWGLALLEPIALDRKAGRQALDQLVKQGTKRLQQGRWVIIFPEGTRVPAGRKGKYHSGGAILAAKSGYPIVPVAHNAGEFWPRRSFIKHPGTIRVSIGPVIETAGRRSKDIITAAEMRIEGMMNELTGSTGD